MRLVHFTEVGVVFVYTCHEPLCSFTAQHSMLFDELAVHMHVFKTTQMQAIRQNRRFFIKKYKNHNHQYWSYEI